MKKISNKAVARLKKEYKLFWVDCDEVAGFFILIYENRSGDRYYEVCNRVH